MKVAKPTVSLGIWAPELSKLVWSSGVPLNRQETGGGLGGNPRSLWNSSLDTPCSTLYASPAKSSSDLFCAFHPNRAMVPSLPFRLGWPEMPRDCLSAALAFIL